MTSLVIKEQKLTSESRSSVEYVMSTGNTTLVLWYSNLTKEIESHVGMF